MGGEVDSRPKKVMFLWLFRGVLKRGAFSCKLFPGFRHQKITERRSAASQRNIRIWRFQKFGKIWGSKHFWNGRVQFFTERFSKFQIPVFEQLWSVLNAFYYPSVLLPAYLVIPEKGGYCTAMGARGSRVGYGFVVLSTGPLP